MLLSFGQCSLLIGQEWIAGPPSEDGSWRSLALVATLVETMVLLFHSLLQDLHLLVKMSVGFVHTRISALPQRRILLMLLAGCRLGHLALQICFKFVQSIQSLMALYVLRFNWFSGKKRWQAASILIPYVNFLQACPVFVLHAFDEGMKRGPARLVLKFICTHQERIKSFYVIHSSYSSDIYSGFASSRCYFLFLKLNISN